MTVLLVVAVAPAVATGVVVATIKHDGSCS